MKACFSEEKLIKQFEKPLSKRTLISANPLFLSNFFVTPLFVQILHIRNPLILGGRKLRSYSDSRSMENILQTET